VKKRSQRTSKSDLDENMLQLIREECSSGMIQITKDEDCLYICNAVQKDNT